MHVNKKLYFDGDALPVQYQCPFQDNGARLGRKVRKVMLYMKLSEDRIPRAGACAADGPTLPVAFSVDPNTTTMTTKITTAGWIGSGALH